MKRAPGRAVYAAGFAPRRLPRLTRRRGVEARGVKARTLRKFTGNALARRKPRSFAPLARTGEGGANFAARPEHTKNAAGGPAAFLYLSAVSRAAVNFR